MTTMARLLIGLAFVALTTTAAHAETLSSEDLQSVLTGRSVSLINPHGIPSKWTFMKEGGVKGEAYMNTKTARDSGTWWTENPDRFCYKWKHWSAKKTFCYRMTHIGGEIHPLDPNGAKMDHPWRLLVEKKPAP